MSELDAGRIAVGSLLSQQSFFRVPDYQRPFSWDGEHFDDLIDDLIKADKKNQYFLGTIVLHSVDKSGNYDIVDGQQRLTSLIILLACLRDAVSDPNFKSPIQEKISQKENKVDGIPAHVRLEVREKKTFNEMIVSDGGTLKDMKAANLPDPEWRYVTAVTIFRARLAKMSEAQLQELITFISQKCILVKLSTESFSDAFRLFTIVNDRGKQLRRIDVLKAKNMSPEVIAKATIRESYAHRWAEYENELGAEIFESIIYLIRLVFLKEKPQGDLLSEFEDKIFGKHLKMGEEFFNCVFAYCDIYRSVFSDRDIIQANPDDAIKFENLIYIMDAEFDASEWRACVLSYANKFNENGIIEFLYYIEKIYCTQWFAGTRKDERYADYSVILRNIETAKDPKDVVGSEAVHLDDATLRKGVANPRLYGAGYRKYVLLRLELNASEQDQVRRIDAKSIEHVLPQQPKEGSDWLKSHIASKIDEYVDSVGNLVLISKSKNSSASNKEFDDKKKTYLRTRVSDYPRSVKILEEQSWTRELIEARTAEASTNIFCKL